jgi:hypothetical protein
MTTLDISHFGQRDCRRGGWAKWTKGGGLGAWMIWHTRKYFYWLEVHLEQSIEATQNNTKIQTDYHELGDLLAATLN